MFKNQEEHEIGRMKGLAAILGAAVLMALVVACGNGAEPTSLSDEVPTPAPPTEIPLTQVIALARTGDLQSIEVSGDKLEVTTPRGETFASRKGEGTSIVELLDRAGVDHIANGLQIILKGSTARERDPTSAGQTTVTLTPTPTSTSDEVSTPAPGQLSEWYEEAQKAVWPIDGVYTSNIDERRNRIVFGVQTSYVAQQAREALAKTSVPEEAVVFEVAPKKRLDDPPVRVDTPIGVSISLELERTARVGQSVSIEVVLTNKGDGAAGFGHGVPFHENVMIFTSDGALVWTKLRGVQVGVGGSTRLQPSETVRLQTLWNQRDQDGFELPAGRYLVRGTIRIVDDLGDDGPFFSGMDLATESYELIIQP